MRTPWKMLADLVSGKSSKEDGENISPSAPAAADAVNEAVRKGNAALANGEKPDAAASRAETVAATDKAKPVAEVDPAEKPLIDESQPVDLAPPAPTTKPGPRPLSTQPSKSPAVASAKRPAAQAKKVTAAPIAAAASDEKPAVDLPSVPVAKQEPKSAPDEMVDLDREIEGLRQQLAEKLARQNAQLRKLIDRYDGR